MGPSYNRDRLVQVKAGCANTPIHWTTGKIHLIDDKILPVASSYFKEELLRFLVETNDFEKDLLSLQRTHGAKNSICDLLIIGTDIGIVGGMGSAVL
jgi:hypothetical protein